ncbi:MAG: hypothetical protein JWL69_4221 [Phycisphaerales bacterium]|nr:hypothetical protein [Phycisphaerales bacterium]
MTSKSKRRLLFIEPQEPPSSPPVLDTITRMMCAAFRQAKNSDYGYGGIHQCRCGANSSACDYFLPDGTMTNSLCVHYVAHHRNSVSFEELAIVAAFAWGEADPTDDELQSPEILALRTRRMVERYLGDTTQKTWRAWGLDIESLCSLLREFNSEDRQSAEDLFTLLGYFSGQMSMLSTALGNLKLDAAIWGSESLRLPAWSRSAWMAPMLELLQARYGEPRERRYVAYYFRHLRSPGAPLPQSLIDLSETAEGDIKSAALLAIRGLSGD